jgi:hypothetical protein
MGSLVPDSSSRRPRILWAGLGPRPRNSAKSAAASVDDTITPSSRASGQVNPPAPMSKSVNVPSTPAVATTPTVARTRPGARTGRTVDHRVLSPPENRITASAAVPTACASSGESNSSPPGPSEPASIPTARNSSSDGTRSRSDTRAANTAASSSTPTTRMTASTVTLEVFTTDPSNEAHSCQLEASKGARRRNGDRPIHGVSHDSPSVPSPSAQRVGPLRPSLGQSP